MRENKITSPVIVHQDIKLSDFLFVVVKVILPHELSVTLIISLTGVEPIGQALPKIQIARKDMVL